MESKASFETLVTTTTLQDVSRRQASSKRVHPVYSDNHVQAKELKNVCQVCSKQAVGTADIVVRPVVRRQPDVSVEHWALS
jgi:hypothetical protein